MNAYKAEGAALTRRWGEGVSKFQKLISDEYGIDHIKASTCRSNGKIESVNKQFDKEVLKVQYFSNLEDMNTGVCEWIQFYNFGRTHMGLPEGMVPADRFLPGWNYAKSVTQSNDTFFEQFTKSIITKEQWREIFNLAIKKIG